MKRIFGIIASALVLFGAVSCSKTIEEPLTIEGEWQLSSVRTKACNVNGTNVDVYVSFNAGSFDLYQKVGEGRYTHFTGTYTLLDKKLSGKYSDGTSWAASYEVSRDGDTMVFLSDTSTQEESTYKKTSIPQSVLDYLQ